MVVVVVVSVVCRGVVIFGTLASATVFRISQGGSYTVAVPVVERMIRIVMVVIVINGPIVVMIPVPAMIVPVGVVVIPSPAVMETIVIPSVIVIVWTVVIAWPPPVVSHVNA